MPFCVGRIMGSAFGPILPCPWEAMLAYTFIAVQQQNSPLLRTYYPALNRDQNGWLLRSYENWYFHLDISPFLRDHNGLSGRKENHIVVGWPLIWSLLTPRPLCFYPPPTGLRSSTLPIWSSLGTQPAPTSSAPQRTLTSGEPTCQSLNKQPTSPLSCR